MRTRHTVGLRLLFALFILSVVLSAGPILSGQSGRVIAFPQAPHPDAIGTQVGPINTYVSKVTLSPPASIQRAGLAYSEIRGTIEGVGWGGQPVTLLCHYSYALQYVLRIPPAWDGGLVLFRHGSAGLAVWQELEATLGSQSIGRIFHESVDRHISDVALHPNRRWAFFAVNHVGIAAGGAPNTRLLGGEPGCGAALPTQSAVDVSIGRDHALLAQRLLKELRGREPTLTLAAGHSSGAFVNFLLNAGVDHRRPGGPIQVGDNHRTPYQPGSGRIVDGFLSLQGGSGATLPADRVGGLSAPTIFLANEADRGMGGSVMTINQMTLNAAVNVQALSRLYTVLNMPHIDADLVWSLKRDGTDFSDPVIPEHFTGGGERLKPLTAALLDALANWAARGIAPPPSVFNGEVKTAPDHIEFYRTSPPATSFPYVDDDSLDTYSQPPPVIPNAAQRAAWSNVRTALGGVIGSIVLPETACRRGRFNFAGIGPIGTYFTPFDELTFLGRWGSSAAHQSCRVETADALAASGFYDGTVVTIDVQPDAFPNVVEIGAVGRLTVAILSTAAFDATEIVPGSLRLASASAYGRAATPGDVQASVIDVNGDGRIDLVVEFRIERLTLNPDDIVVDVWGQTRSGVAFSGSDLVEVVP